jgi:hypothetical protein
VAQAASAKPSETETTRRAGRTKFDCIVLVLAFLNWPPVRRPKTTSANGGWTITIIGSPAGSKPPLTFTDAVTSYWPARLPASQIGEIGCRSSTEGHIALASIPYKFLAGGAGDRAGTARAISGAGPIGI